MRFLSSLSVIITCLLFLACQKKVDIKPTSSLQQAGILSDGALTPLKYHAASFTTNYPIVKGKVPPFSFTKTFYPDTRVKTLHMVSRYDANVENSTKQYIVWDYTFTYANNMAFAKGMYRTYYAPTGKLVSTNKNNISFNFNAAGFCSTIVEDRGADGKFYLLSVGYTSNNKILQFLGNQDALSYQITTDARGNVTQMESDFYPPDYNKLNYTYNLASTPKGTLFYQPTQYAVSQWYSLLEVMQWVPPPHNPRTRVDLRVVTSFDTYGATYVYQSQKYLNHKYDANGNLISYTYGDNVLQKITWK